MTGKDKKINLSKAMDLEGLEIINVSPRFLEEGLRRMAEENRKYDDDLRARHRPLSDLLIDVDLKVVNYVSQDFLRIINLERQGFIGKDYSQEDVGYSRLLTMEVIPTTDSVPIRTLEFLGSAQVMPGDIITATICPFTTEFCRESFGGIQRSVYLPRELTWKEEALQIRYFDEEGVARRTERSVNYVKYQKQ